MRTIFRFIITLSLVSFISCEEEHTLPDYPQPVQQPTQNPSATTDPQEPETPDTPSVTDPTEPETPETPTPPADVENPEPPSEPDPDPVTPDVSAAAGWYEYGSRTEVAKVRWVGSQFDFFDANNNFLFYVEVYSAVPGAFSCVSFDAKAGQYDFSPNTFSCTDKKDLEDWVFTMTSGTLIVSVEGDIYTFELSGKDDTNRSVAAYYRGTVERREIY